MITWEQYESDRFGYGPEYAQRATIRSAYIKVKILEEYFDIPKHTNENET